MARPTTKTELTTASESLYETLCSYIKQLDGTQQEEEFPRTYMNRNIRDVLAHLHHWQLLFMGWYRVGMRGEKPAIPAAGYTWRSTAQLNISIQKQYCTFSLSEVMERLEKSHQQLLTIIEQHSQQELFEKKVYPWTGSTSLGAFLISATSSHYHWALKLIKKARRESLTQANI